MNRYRSTQYVDFVLKSFFTDLLFRLLIYSVSRWYFVLVLRYIAWEQKTPCLKQYVCREFNSVALPILTFIPVRVGIVEGGKGGGKGGQANYA